MFINFDFLGGRDWSENSPISGKIISTFMHADFSIFVFPLFRCSRFLQSPPPTMEISRPLQYFVLFCLLDRETVFMFPEGEHINGLQPWMCDTAKKNVRSNRFFIKFVWISSPFLFFFPSLPPSLFRYDRRFIFKYSSCALLLLAFPRTCFDVPRAFCFFTAQLFTARTAFCRNRESINRPSRFFISRTVFPDCKTVCYAFTYIFTEKVSFYASRHVCIATRFFGCNELHYNDVWLYHRNYFWWFWILRTLSTRPE